MDRSPRVIVILMVLVISVLVIQYSSPFFIKQGEREGEMDQISGSIPNLPAEKGMIPVMINRSISTTRKELDLVAGIPDKERNCENTLLRFEEIMTGFDDATLSLLFIADECQELQISEEAAKARELRNRFLHDVYLRSDLAHALSVLSVHAGPEHQLLEKHTKSFIAASLPSGSREELTSLGENLSVLEATYRKNQKKGSIMKNLRLIPEIMHLREKIVRLLGYETFSGFQIRRSGFSSDLPGLLVWMSEKSLPYIWLSHQEAGSLLKIKQKTDPYATAVFDYEILPLMAEMEELTSGCTKTATRKSYQADDVLIQTNRFLSGFFAINISPGIPVPGYSDSLNLYCLTDMKTGKIRAWYYLGFNTHTLPESRGRTYYLRSGHMSKGEWIPPVSAIIMTVPANSSAGNLTVHAADIQTLFHEIGHMIRHSLVLSPYATLSSGAYEDGAYTEVPSLVCEKLFSFPEIFQAVTGTGGTVTSLDTCNQSAGSKIHAKERGTGYSQAYTYVLSCIDLALGSGDFLILNKYPDIYENLTGFRTASGGVNLLEDPAFFIGNPGMYWHYAVGEVYADMIIRDISDGSRLNENAGDVLRKKYFEKADYIRLLEEQNISAENEKWS